MFSLEVVLHNIEHISLLASSLTFLHCNFLLLISQVITLILALLYYTQFVPCILYFTMATL